MNDATTIEGEVISTMDHGHVAGIVVETYTPYHQQVPIALCDAPGAARGSNADLVRQLLESLGLDDLDELRGRDVKAVCDGRSMMPGMLAATPQGITLD